jgi:hypothetical protein
MWPIVLGVAIAMVVLALIGWCWWSCCTMVDTINSAND